MQTRTGITFSAPVLAFLLLPACDMESPPLSATDRVTLKSRGGAAELQEISVFILERFYDRGVTLEEAHAVVESGNEDAALELLGMNAREARRLYDRYAAALDRA